MLVDRDGILGRHTCNIVTGVKLYPSFGEAQLSIGIGAAEKSGDQHARLEMEGLLNELSWTLSGLGPVSATLARVFRLSWPPRHSCKI